MSSTSIVTINLYCDIIAAWIWVMEPMNIIMAYQGVAEKEKLHESVVNPLECWFSGSTYQYATISQGIHQFVALFRFESMYTHRTTYSFILAWHD